jgi:patatin-like phospholipase/acyl hydrolase
MEKDDAKTFKILSIDGGGIKGLYSMAVLNEFEKKYCIPNNKLLSDYFNMICGT